MSTMMKNAYILLECEEYTDPKVVGVTLDRERAEAWKAKRPCKWDADYWNSYTVTDFLDYDNMGSVTGVLL